MAERSVDVENIELRVDDRHEEGVNIDIEQSTDQVPVLEIGAGAALGNGYVPSGQISSGSEGQAVVESLEASEEYSPFCDDKRDPTKQYDEWIFVDVNKSTHELKENLLVMSSVYGQQECCVIL